MFASEVKKETIFRSVACAAILCVSADVWADAVRPDGSISFNIPQQRADASLTAFAEQANITLIFPFDAAKEVMANALVGDYTAQQALEALLANTSLVVRLGEDGQLSISRSELTEDTDSVAKKNKLSSAIIGVLSTVAAQQALAQQPIVEEVLVTGIRGSLQRSMDVKRDSVGVVDAISAEDIGKFPDTNLAESLQRISGVSIDRSGGEGQLITVRGFGPEFNSVLLNGRQLATENQSRAFSFDTVASELVSGLEVHKTSSATTQSGGIGSTVNVKTARPFDSYGFKVAGSIKGVYDDNSGKTGPQGAVLVSNTFNDDKFGALLSLSYQRRDARLDRAEIDGWLENVGIPEAELNGGAGVPEGTTVFIPRNYNFIVSFEERTRTNGSLVLQFAPTDRLTLSADFVYSDFDVETVAPAYGNWFTGTNVTDVITDANGTVIDVSQERGLATDMQIKKFDRLTETTLIGLNADWDVTDQLNLSFDFSHSTAEREPNNGGEDFLSIVGYANRVRFISDGADLPYFVNFTEANPNIFSGQQVLDKTAYLDPSDPNYEPPDGVSDFLDKANTRAHVQLRRGWAVEDEVNQFRVDGLWEEGASSGLVAAKFGMQYSEQTKSLEDWSNETGVHCTYCGYPDLPDIPDNMQWVFDAGSDFLKDASGSGRMPTQWLTHDAEQLISFLENHYFTSTGDRISYDAVKRGNSFEVSENTLAFYTEVDFAGQLANRPITATAGVRLENTRTEVDGTEAPITGLRILDQTEMQPLYGAANAISEKDSYGVILPNMNISMEITDNMLVRIAGSKTLTRPTLEYLAPVTVITTTRQGGDFRSTSGNAVLKPFSSENFDLSWEWYYDDVSYVSIGYFAKEVSNFIVNVQEDLTFTLPDGSPLTDPTTGTDLGEPDAADGEAVFVNSVPINGETASVEGVEFSIQHTFGDTGFGVIFNATMVDSNAELDPSNINQVFALTGLSDSMNLVGFYEKDKVQVRLAYNYRDQFVQKLTQVQGNGPTIVEDYSQLDLSAHYDITDAVSVFIEGINLTGEYLHKRGRYDNHLLQMEDSGTRWALGVRASF
ncbi:MAG: TonB-dependent receptor [Cellvibrionaceae bacterium]|nr:TonB-dependent receptor [Cellvibrionaceae bacterium]